MTNRTRKINDHGIGFAGIDQEIIRDIKIYNKGSSVQIWVETMMRGGSEETIEALQCLTPAEAMAFAKAFERCAIQAFKDSA